LQRNPLLRQHNLARLQERGGTLEIAGYPITTLSMEDQLLNLCAHAATNYWSQLLWLVDIAEIVSQYQHVDWHALMISAQKQNAGRILGQGIILAHIFLKNPLPAPVGALAQRDPAVLYLVKKAIQRIQMPATELRSMAEFVRHLGYRLKLSAELNYKLLIIMQILLCPDDWQKLIKFKPSMR
jgi:hypothetical protein